MKKIINNILLFFFAATLFSSCDKDGDLIYLNGFDSSELMASSSDVALSASNSKKIVLSLAWNNPTLLSSDSSKAATNSILTTYLQVSSDKDFNSSVNTSTVTNLSKVYTGDDLNSLAKELGLNADISSPLYFRIKSSEGANMEPKYSNVCTVNVTPFTIHMNYVSVINKAKTDTITKLYSDSENGVYTGYMTATGWQNCWFVENNGTVWGNYGADNHEFELSNASDAWNCWFADGSGDWYVTVDTNNEIWSCANITGVTLSDGTAMEYKSNKSAWTAVITTTAANTVIGGTATAKEYNSTTRTSSYVDKTLALPDTTITKAGTYTVSLVINEHADYEYKIVEGIVSDEDEEVKLPTTLCMYDKTGTTLKATLSQTSKGIYSCDYVATQWENFKFIDTENNIWYGSDPSNLFTLSSDGSAWDIWFKDDIASGTTVTVTVNLNTKTWNYTTK
jgi:hypothetical protein